ncbi:hypothetical protein Tco_0557276 [Tanacetum coccineum]
MKMIGRNVGWKNALKIQCVRLGRISWKPRYGMDPYALMAEVGYLVMAICWDCDMHGKGEHQKDRQELMDIPQAPAFYHSPMEGNIDGGQHSLWIWSQSFLRCRKAMTPFG